MTNDRIPTMFRSDWEDKFNPGDLLELDDRTAATTDVHHIWTLCETGAGDNIIGAGRHGVNRIGFYVTAVPWTDDRMVICDDDMNGDDRPWLSTRFTR
jgi:hypothetical protein